MMRSALHANTNNRKRNLYLATALTLLALSFLFAPGESGMLWMMWRDTTWLAAVLVVLAVLFIVLWRRTPRNRGHHRRPRSAYPTRHASRGGPGAKG